MKPKIILFMIISGLGFAACSPIGMSDQTLAQTASLPTRITSVPMFSTTVPSPTSTLAPSTPTHIPTETPTKIPTHTLLPTETTTQMPTHTSTSTPDTPTPFLTSKGDIISDRLLPDLQTLPPADLRLLYNAETGRALIRFTNSIWNSGPGVLELIGIPSQAKDKIRVSQRIFAADPEVFDEYEVGEFIFHDQHKHWHLEQFAIYEVWSVDESGSLEALVSSAEKVSWCVLDEYPAETDLPNGEISNRPIYTHCEDEIQGLSVGWIDTYEYYLPRQWVEITSLEDGFYALVSTVDPDHLLYEADIHNNTGISYFEIRELRLTPLEKQFFEDGSNPLPGG